MKRLRQFAAAITGALRNIVRPESDRHFRSRIMGAGRETSSPRDQPTRTGTATAEMSISVGSTHGACQAAGPRSGHSGALGAAVWWPGSARIARWDGQTVDETTCQVRGCFRSNEN